MLRLLVPFISLTWRAALCPSDTDLRKWVGEEGEVKREGEGGGGEGGGEGGEDERAGRDEEDEEEDDPLTESTAEDEVGKLLRSTLQELETALQVCRLYNLPSNLVINSRYFIGVTQVIS